MPRSKKKPSLQSKEDRLRSFFVGLTAKVIHDYKYKSISDATKMAEKVVDKDWPFLITMLEKAFVEWNATPRGLFLITKPLTHRFFFNKEYSMYGGPQEDCLIKAGKATILLTDNSVANIKFSDKKFSHGHIDKSGIVGCRGFYYGKNGFETNLMDYGPSNLLATTLTFCVTSRYGTKGTKIVA